MIEPTVFIAMDHLVKRLLLVEGKGTKFCSYQRKDLSFSAPFANRLCGSPTFLLEGHQELFILGKPAKN
jgi:hypothetical protein